MNYRKTLSIFCYLFFFTAVCPAQEMNNTFLRIQDSINAMQQLPGRGIANVKPFFSSGAPAKDLLNTHWSAGTLNEAGTTCFDTSQRSFVINDTAYFFSREPYPSADGNIFLSGLFASSSGAYNYGGFLAKLDYKGHVLWHRTYSWQNKAGYYFINYYRVMELQDGSIFLGGITNDLVNGNNNIIYTKTDKNGNVIWSKIYKSRLWGPGSGSADYYYIQQMKEDKLTGDIYVTGPTWSDGRTMMKINSTNGNIAWGKSYQGGGSFDFPIGLEVKTNEIRMFSKSLSYNNAIISMTRINKATGDTIACKYWVSSDTAGIRVDFLGADPLTVLNNGNYVLTGKTYGNYIYPPGSTAYYQASVVEFDNNLNFIKAYNFRNSIESNSSNTVITTYPDGSSFFTMLHYISGYTADVYSIQLSNGQIVRQRMKHTTLGLPYEPQAIRAPDGGDLIMRLVGDTTDGVNKIEVMNLHTSDTASACLGINDNSTYLYPFNVVPSQFYTGTVQSDVFEETTNQNIISTFTTDHYLPGCVQVSNCDSIKLIPSATLLCKSQKLIITGKKNIGCGSNIVWQYNTQGITSASQPNDSTLEINFSGAWSGYIYGSIRGCSVKTDSVFINVIQTPASIDLGADFSICPGNTKLLNAHYGFLSYKWQTGSTDSTFLATQPGTYYVSATDACGVT